MLEQPISTIHTAKQVCKQVSNNAIFLFSLPFQFIYQFIHVMAKAEGGGVINQKRKDTVMAYSNKYKNSTEQYNKN